MLSSKILDGDRATNQTALTFSFNETAYNNREPSALFKRKRNGKRRS